MRSFALILALAACSTTAGPKRQIVAGRWPIWHEPRAGTPPPTDAVGLRAALGTQAQVLDGGLWFADPLCRTRFAKARAIATPEFEGFAACLAKLDLHATTRRSGHDDTSVLADAAGFELEARVVEGKLDFIGYSGRGASAPDLPMITPEALEALRTGGTRDDAPPELEKTIGRRPRPSAYLRVCVAADGATTVGLASEATPEYAADLAASVKAWTFKPFTVGEQVVPACAIVAIPAADPSVVPVPPGRSKAGGVQFAIAARQLEALRDGGDPRIVPDDRDTVELHDVRLAGEYKLCLDEQGHVETATTTQSTGVPTYDAKVARTMLETWKFRSYRFAGIGMPVCVRVRLVYTER